MFWLLIKCACCERSPVLPSYRQNTIYPEDELNWTPPLCPMCKDADDEHWRSMWQEYEQGRL